MKSMTVSEYSEALAKKFDQMESAALARWTVKRAQAIQVKIACAGNIAALSSKAS